jgi:hypothetical protein
MPAQGTYYLNDTVWASGDANTATKIYTDSSLAAGSVAPNGWYKDNNNVYRQVTGSNGTLGTSATCTSCGDPIVLNTGSSAFAACCGSVSATYYLDPTETWNDATMIYTTPLLGTKAADQFYSYNDSGTKTSREKTSDTSLGAKTACATCYPAIVLAFASTADGACCEGTVATYYMNQTTFSASTVLYDASDGSSFAAAGFYSQVSASSVYKQVTGASGAMSTGTSACNACPTSISLCYDASSVDTLCCTGCSSLTNFSSTDSTNFNAACTATIVTNNLWHNGSGTYPVAGDSVFTNSAGTGNPTGGAISWSDGGTRKIGPISIGGGGGATMGSVADCI